MIEPLLLDLLEWVAKEPRSYADVMEAWRTSCPRLPVWEEATDRGFLQRTAADRPTCETVRPAPSSVDTSPANLPPGQCQICPGPDMDDGQG